MDWLQRLDTVQSSLILLQFAFQRAHIPPRELTAFFEKEDRSGDFFAFWVGV